MECIDPAKESTAEIPLFETSDRESAGNSEATKKSAVKVLAANAMLIAAYSAIYYIRENALPISFIIISGLFTVYFVTEFMIRAKKNISNNYNAFRFYEDRYVNYDRLSKTAVPYELMVMAKETKELIMLYAESGRVHVVLKSTLTHGTAEELSEFLRKRIKKYKKCK